jgi:mannose-1-phosphate guanylyltransferase
MTQQRVALVLAGGNGQRLLPFTRLVSRDDTPKQFCTVFGQRTLLADTLDRTKLNVPARNTFTVVTAAHQRFYREALSWMPAPLLVEQPANCGTAAGIAYGLSRIRREVGDDSIVGLFPADHWFAEASVLARTVDLAYASAELNPDALYLLGAKPSIPETEYGWIERAPATHRAALARSVLRFWEKPTAEIARLLMTRDCLWNTFIVIGTLRAFTQALDRHLPAWRDAFDVFAKPLPAEARVARTVYESLEPTDFSSAVLQRVSPSRLLALDIGDAGWTDLGQPARVIATLRARGMAAPTLHAAS